MTIKDKIIFLTLSIITIGIYPYVVLKGTNKGKANILSVTTKTTIDVDKLLDIITIDNIEGVTNTHTKVKIELKQNVKIDAEKIQELKGVSGVFATSSSLTILVGNSAKTISEAIQGKL